MDETQTDVVTDALVEVGIAGRIVEFVRRIDGLLEIRHRRVARRSTIAELDLRTIVATPLQADVRQDAEVVLCGWVDAEGGLQIKILFALEVRVLEVETHIGIVVGGMETPSYLTTLTQVALNVLAGVGSIVAGIQRVGLEDVEILVGEIRD